MANVKQERFFGRFERQEARLEQSTNSVNFLANDNVNLRELGGHRTTGFCPHGVAGFCRQRRLLCGICCDHRRRAFMGIFADGLESGQVLSGSFARGVLWRHHLASVPQYLLRRASSAGRYPSVKPPLRSVPWQSKATNSLNPSSGSCTVSAAA
jgi:hypothetical protein